MKTIPAIPPTQEIEEGDFDDAPNENGHVLVDPQEEIREHQRRQAEALAVRESREKAREPDGEQEAALFTNYLTGPRNLDSFTIPVQCPLPLYGGVTVHFRTNNPTKVRRARPFKVNTPETMQLLATLRELDEANTSTNSPEYLSAIEQLERLGEERDAEYQKRAVSWLAMFVKRMEPWPFEGVPEIDPAKPETYAFLYEECEDLAGWLENDGYNLALEKSLGNFGRS